MINKYDDTLCGIKMLKSWSYDVMLWLVTSAMYSNSDDHMIIADDNLEISLLMHCCGKIKVLAKTQWMSTETNSLD